MNVVRALQIRCSAENSLAECERNGAALLTVKQPGKKARDVARGTVRAKLPGTPGKRRVLQDAPDSRARGSSAGRASPEKPTGGGESAVQKNEISVAELSLTICVVPENRKKRVKLAEALRERGLDEAKVATMYSGVAEKLSRNKEPGAVGVAAAKLLFDVLKELADWLEPEKSVGSSDASEAPQFVRLIHNVPRPVRTE